MGVARGFVTGVVLLCALVLVPPAAAQVSAAGALAEAVDGEVVAVALDDGRTVRVRLIGVDAPDAAECGSPEAIELLDQYVGQRVTVTTDPTQPVADEAGRVLAYVDTDRAVDLGHKLIAAGRAGVRRPGGPAFQRLDSYTRAETQASIDHLGTWRSCDGDFHRPAGEEAVATVSRRDEAENHVREFHDLLRRRRYAAAWDLLSAGLRARLDPYLSWRAEARRTRSATITGVKVALAGKRAIVRHALRRRARDACSQRVGTEVVQVRWVLAQRGDGWIATAMTVRHSSGTRLRMRRSACAN